MQFDDLDPSRDQPRWLPAINRWVQRLGLRRSLVLLVAAVWLLALGISHAIVSLVGGSRLMATLCSSICAFGITLPFGYFFLSLVQHLDQAYQRMSQHAMQDALTGTYNRRHFLNLVEREWARARRYDMPCALLLLDVDHFKQVNDGFGHLCGDQLLCEIAAATGETLRQPDVLARFGGEEFIVFLPHTDPLGALDVAERVRERIAALDFRWQQRPVPVSASLGVAALHPSHISLDQLISEADEALYRAKAAGRNCVRAGAGFLPGGRTSVLS